METRLNLFNTINFTDLTTWDVKRYREKKDIFNQIYQIVPLNKVLSENTMKWEIINDEKEYAILGVRSYGKGAYINRISYGRMLKMKKYQKSQANHLFWCKVDTKNGAFGIVTEELENSYGSSNMSYLQIDTQIIQLEYLQLLFTSPEFNAYMDNKVIGVTNRKYISKQTLLNEVFIALPSLKTQKELVSNYNLTVQKAETMENEAFMLESGIDEYLFSILSIDIPIIDNSCKFLLQSTSFAKLFKWGAEINISAINPKDLFKSTSYKNVSILTAYEINPLTKFDDSIEDISFLPMECVSDIYGEIIQLRDGLASKSKGYTRFKENDILWAKITPCMQNGKCAVVKNLKSNYGYGSTEYHVFRAINGKAIPEYIYQFLRTKIIRQVAQSYFTGSSGQQRVGSDFLDALYIPLPPIEKQTQIANHINKLKTKIKELKTQAEHLRISAKKDFEGAIFNGK